MVRARLIHRTSSAAAEAMTSAAAVSSRVARCAHVATAERRSAKVSLRKTRRRGGSGREGAPGAAAEPVGTRRRNQDVVQAHVWRSEADPKDGN